MNEEKEKIIGFASQKFFESGFYDTTMDEIAAEMRMSKKTIYKNFSSKEDLVREVAYRFFVNNSKLVDKAVKTKGNAVEKLFNVFETVSSIIMKVNDKISMDIHHYVPDIWKEIDEFRTKKMTAFLTDIISQGQREGYLTKKKPQIINTLFVAAVRAVVNPTFAVQNHFTLKEALDETIEILMNGILTDKGKKIFIKLKNGEN